MSTTYDCIQRPDSRIVAYSDSGPQDGNPVLICHKLPSACNQIPNTVILEQHKVRVILIDLPGFGISTADQHVDSLIGCILPWRSSLHSAWYRECCVSFQPA